MGFAGCFLASLALAGGFGAAGGLVAAGGFAVAVLAGLAAAALMVAADAAGAASPTSATATIMMPGRRPRLPRLARLPPNELCRPAPLVARSVTRMSIHSRVLNLPSLAWPPVTRSMVVTSPLFGWPRARLRPWGWRHARRARARGPGGFQSSGNVIAWGQALEDRAGGPLPIRDGLGREE
jgi:hypothetical protein